MTSSRWEYLTPLVASPALCLGLLPWAVAALFPQSHGFFQLLSRALEPTGLGLSGPLAVGIFGYTAKAAMNNWHPPTAEAEVLRSPIRAQLRWRSAICLGWAALPAASLLLTYLLQPSLQPKAIGLILVSAFAAGITALASCVLAHSTLRTILAEELEPE